LAEARVETKTPTEKPEPQPPAKAQAAVATQPEPAATPAPVVAPTPPAPDTSCVTGYFTGNSYEDYIINHESGGNSCALNYLGCFGLMQACPGEPLREACGGNPECQINWFWTNKVLSGYGSWATVYNHEIAYGWW
jgi:hypothetical protein